MQKRNFILTRFHFHRSNLTKLDQSDIAHIRANPTIWNVHSVLNVLHSLVEKSHINPQLEVGFSFSF